MSSIRSNVGNGVSEIRALTGLRGIASLYVVLFHYFQPLPLVGYLRTLLGHGYLAVDLFFVLSGFVMALNYGSRFAAGAHWPEYRLFLCRRFARVYPPLSLCLSGRLCTRADRPSGIHWPSPKRGTVD